MAKKSKATTIRTREELESVMGEYAAQVLERDRLTVKMEQEIAEVRKQYEAGIAACVESGDGLFEDIQAWASLHPDEFAQKKSIDLLHGAIGFRTGTPAVKQAMGVKAEHSVELLRDADRGWTRIKTEIDKERILSDLAAGLIAEADLGQFGLRIERTETFWAEIKREDGKE